MLPEMLERQMGWNVYRGGRWSMGGWASGQILVDEGYHTFDDFQFTSHTKGLTEIKAMITNQQQTGIDENGNPYVYNPPANSGDYDLILFLNSTGNPYAEILKHGTGMMNERNYARWMHALDPTATIIGLAVWPPSTPDYEELAANADLNLTAWRGAAGAASEAQKIFDLETDSKGVTWNTLKTLWDQAGNIDRFIAAPVAEAWKMAYAEPHIPTVVYSFSSIFRRQFFVQFLYVLTGVVKIDSDSPMAAR